MDQQPSIAVRINTSSPICDLSKQEPFTIQITLTLNHAKPITFDKCFAGLFDGKLLAQGGLTFTNVSTDVQVHRRKLNVCYLSSDDDGTPKERSKDRFMTLSPGKSHSIEAKFSPRLTNSVFPTQGLSKDEIIAKQNASPKTWKWGSVYGMKDGETYEVGISDRAVVPTWMQGSVNGLLEVKKLGLVPEIKRNAVVYVVEESARFEMRRPDKDGSLNWP